MARGKAPGLENPVVPDVNCDRQADLANSYPKKWSAMARLIRRAERWISVRSLALCWDAVSGDATTA